MYFITGHAIPISGALSLEFPKTYFVDFYVLQITCQLEGSFRSAERPTCKIGDKNRVDINLNGVELSSTQEYIITVNGITNPNVDSSNLKLKIISYYHSNIYKN